MIEITIILDDHGFKQVIANGHALFDTKGKDIVCASISTLLQSWIIGLRYALPLQEKTQITMQKKEGFLQFGVISKALSPKECEQILLIFKVFYLSLKEIEKDYPQSIRIKEQKEQ